MNAPLEVADEKAVLLLEARRRWIRFGIGALLIVILTACAFPLYRAGKRWRARQLAAAAESEIAQNHLPEAQAKAQAAFQLGPQEPEVLRAMARFYAASGNPSGAVAFLEQLKKLGADLPEDRRQLAAELLRGGAADQARGEIQRLLAEQPRDARNLRLAARAAAAGRQMGEAIGFARRACEIDPLDRDGSLLLAVLETESGEPEDRAVGLEAMQKLSQGSDRIALQALENLAVMPDLTPEAQARVAALLRQHPASAENDRLLALDIDLRLRPGDRRALLDAAVAGYQKADAEAKREFGAWLNVHHEPERTLAVLPIEAAFLRKDLLLVNLDALAALKRWEEIERILSRKQVPLEDVYTEVFLARADMELGKTSESDLHWRRAHLAAAASPDQTMFLGSYAERIGETRQAELAFRGLTTNAVEARRAYASLLVLAEKTGGTAALRGLLGEMKSRWPKDEAVLNDYVYMSLLLGADIEECRTLAAQLVQKSPGSLPHRSALALADLRLRNAASALSVYGGLEIPWERVAPSARAVYAAVLGANGRDAEARAAAAGLRPEDLRPEEAELIKPWRSQ